MDRKDAPIEFTWDLSLLVKDQGEFETRLQALQAKVEDFKESYQGKDYSLADIESSLACYREILGERSRLATYTSLAVNANVLDKQAADLYAGTNQAMAQMGAKLSFYESELAELDTELLDQASQNPENANFLKDLIEAKAHRLDRKVEEALAALSNSLDYPYQAYNDVKFKDMDFSGFQVDGQEVPMTYNEFESRLEAHPDHKLRKAAFKHFSQTLAKYQHITASAYNAHVQKEKTMASLRGYDSVIDYLLDRQKVSRDLYNRQIDGIMEGLAPHMRKYAALLGHVHGLEKVAYEDLKIDVDPSFVPSVSWDQAKDYVLEGLAALGPDYLSIMQKAFDQRWIDSVASKGKRTGAFCSSPYGSVSYILMFFANKMSDVMTLAHELGHAGHFQNAYQHQNIMNGRSSMYFVEAPSTTNELLVEQYLLDKAGEDPQMKRWVLCQMVAKTYYHNFVTHLLEAYYQREVYYLVDQGANLTADRLNNLYLDTLKKFWGPEVELTPGCELTWMRQPHYYMGLYPYTYSAGLTIGTQVAKRIRQEGSSAAQEWVKVLQMGGSKPAQDLALEAGIDLSSDQPLKDTIAFIGQLIDQIVELSNSLQEA